MKSMNYELYLAMQDLHIPQSALTSIPAGQFALFRVGDCISMHNIHGAIYDALRIAKDF